MRRPNVRYLFVVPSSCQMYSGTGTAVFDWIRYARDRFDFSILMDGAVRTNVQVTRDFCELNGVTFIQGRPSPMPGCVDVAITETAAVILAGGYDVIECVSWANAAANLHVLSALPASTNLVYTPHTQPTWTVGEGANTACIAYAFHRMLARSQAVFLDSLAERNLPIVQGAAAGNLHVVPLGVDTERFTPKGLRSQKSVLCVCDFRETRKRVDLLLAAFGRALEDDPSLTLILAGKGSDTCPIPERIASRVVRHGYVSATELVDLYRAAGVFMLMSDFEAFGLPIAEALCSGAPVLINRQEALVDLFGDLPGVTFTRNDDVQATASHLLKIVSGSPSSAAISAAAAEAFSFKRTYGQKMRIISALTGGRSAVK